MRQAYGAFLAGCLAVAPCALAGPDDDASLAYRAETMADAGRRSQQQGEPAPRVFGGIQMGFLADWRNDAPEDEDDLTHGFLIRRAKLGVEKRYGDLHYRVNGNFSRGSDVFVLEDAWVGAQAGDFLIRAGQFKPPFVYEESVEWHNQLAVERSSTADFFSQDRSQGIEFQYDPEMDFRAKFAATDGIRTPNSDFNAQGEADFAFTGRVDWMLRGHWDTVEDFTSEYGGDEALRFGLSAHHQVAGRTGGRTSRTDVWAATADAQWERNGLSLFGSVVLLQADAVDAGFDLLDVGFVGQAGYRYNARNEIFGRAEILIADDRPNTGSEDQVVFTAGYNHYFDASARFTADIMYLTTETEQTLIRGDTRQGFLRDRGSPQVVFRVAFQFLF